MNNHDLASHLGCKIENITSWHNPSLAIVEDHEGIAEMIKASIAANLNFNEISLLFSFIDASQRLPVLYPEIVVLDCRINSDSGIGLLRSLKERMPKTRWLLYTAYASARTLREAIEAGIDGAVAKKAPLYVLLEAIKAVLSGYRFFCDITSNEIRKHGADEMLSPTERRIVEHISSGLEPKEIAAIIGVAYKTVLNSMVSIRQKTKAASMVQISDYGRRFGVSVLDI